MPSIPCTCLEVARAGLEFAGWVRRGGAHPVCDEAIKQVIFAVQHAHVRAEEFVL
jgi:hypothetical protein